MTDTYQNDMMSENNEMIDSSKSNSSSTSKSNSNTITMIQELEDVDELDLIIEAAIKRKNELLVSTDESMVADLCIRGHQAVLVDQTGWGKGRD